MFCKLLESRGILRRPVGRVIRTVHADTRIAVTGPARLVSEVWDVRSDEGSVRLEIEAADVQVLA